MENSIENFNDSSSSSSSTRYAINNSTATFRFDIPKYKGRNTSNLSIKHWFKAFELVAEHFTWNDRQKLIYLSNYLEDGQIILVSQRRYDKSVRRSIIKSFWTSNESKI